MENYLCFARAPVFPLVSFGIAGQPSQSALSQLLFSPSVRLHRVSFCCQIFLLASRASSRGRAILDLQGTDNVRHRGPPMHSLIRYL